MAISQGGGAIVRLSGIETGNLPSTRSHEKALSSNIIEDTIGFALHHASYLFKGAMKQAFGGAGFDVTPEEFVMLFMLPAKGINQGELVRKSLKDKTNVTRLLTRMEAKGLLKRTQHETSGRQQVVLITKAGDQLRSRLMPVAQQAIAAATRGIDGRDIETARKVLEDIADNLH
ncbi:MarR family transcriptional regulator [Exilibacterium tricleocarpae]|uniref:MarR family transcriptional regulator n=1 Tax=Exilibacterium tricleocarpae TaxID=2591008 RepID=A0A545TAH9_9GAMM|nr:MarR family transcriptional regulator [Exilibacterium tricleocarpae]TQV74222.1 MarR family transcriptional regulator [Exilibacterium tricleocarpae]